MMFKEDDKELKKTREKYQKISIPDNIDEYIQKGIKKGKMQKKNKFRRKLVGFAAGFLIIVFLTTVRLSPTFAQLVSNIPGIDYIVKLVNYDKGLMLAVENNFIQYIGVSDEHEDLVFTVEDIIIDESRMILFYSIENKGDHGNISIQKIDFLDEKSNKLPIAFSYGSFGNNNMNKEKKVYGKINVSFSQDTEIPDIITMRVKLRESEVDRPIQIDGNSTEKFHKSFESTWQLDIPVNKGKFENLKEEYVINKIIEIEGQKIVFERVILYPTRIAIDVAYDDNNSKKIFSFVDLKIIDEKGEYASIKNGVTATHFDENRRRLFMESNYFTKPKELFIVAKGIRALDKEETDIKIDLEKKCIINPPDDKLKLKDINIDIANERMELIFNLKDENLRHQYSVFESRFKDASGKEYENGWSSSSSNMGNEKEIYFSIKNEEYQNPITLKIINYPSIIEEEIKIKVK